LESFGFVWEAADAAVEASSPGASSSGSSTMSPRKPEKGRATAPPPPGHGVQLEQGDPAAGLGPVCAVLLIEMELMAAPPDQCATSCTTEKLTLRTWLQRRQRTLQDAADVFHSLSAGLRHIHRKRIIHADLKPDNIFCVADRGRVTAVRIGDFGLAGENQQDRQFCYGTLRRNQITGGTPGYVAPEIQRAERGRNSEVCLSEKVDVYACAVILLELLFTPSRTQMERVELLHNFSSRAPNGVLDHIGSRLPKTRALLQDMSEDDPSARLSAEELCKHFDKGVRKELCRSSVQACCELPVGSNVSKRHGETVQDRREVAKERHGNSEARAERSKSPSNGGKHRRKGKKVCRKKG